MTLQKAIEENQKRYEKLEDTANWAILHKLGEFDELAYDIDVYEDRVSIEVWPNKFKEARKMLGKGWKLSRMHTSDNGKVFHSYYRKDEYERQGHLTKEVTLLETPEGSTSCKAVQVGTKEVPIMKIVCT